MENNPERIALEREDKTLSSSVESGSGKSCGCHCPVEALLWDLVHSSLWAGYSQVSHTPLLASCLGSCRQLPFKLVLFLETDFKLLNMHH